MDLITTTAVVGQPARRYIDDSAETQEFLKKIEQDVLAHIG